jgi:CheY-like chemotaxis protein
MKKVMIIDNDPNWRMVLANVARRAGHQVVVATTGMDGIKKTLAANPDLVFIDISLPILNGAEATAILKANPMTRDIPIVIQTAFGNSTLAERALQEGAAELLHKPVRFGEIDRVLRTYLGAEPSVEWAARAPRLVDRGRGLEFPQDGLS